MTKAKFKKVQKVLLWVKKQILANPKTYNQDMWCGTQCCIAGWIDKRINGKAANKHLAFEACDNAAIFLTGTRSEPILRSRGMSLFCGGILDTPLRSSPKVGTKAHAEAGARVIDAYLEQEEFCVSVE